VSDAVGGVRLRPVRRDDLAYLVEKQTPDVTGPFNWFGYRSEAEAVSHFEDDGFLGELFGKLIVELDSADGPVPIGDVSWHAVDHGPPPASRCWNIGITLNPEWRGQGHGTRAQRLLADYLFETTLVQRVEASTDVENTAERRALERAGFTFEGVLRQAQFRGGAWHDMALYSLVRGESTGSSP
jgi:RimJ/RimL family protein N-acetyltransferase